MHIENIDDSLLDIAADVFASIGTPRGQEYAEACKRRNLLPVVSGYADPQAFTSARDYALEAQVVALLKKYPFEISGVDPKAAAEATFLTCEVACAATNELFKQYDRGRLWLTPDVDAVLHAARRKIHRALGKFNPSVWLDLCAFGPGKTLGSDGEADVDKLGSDLCCTRSLMLFLPAVLREYPGWNNALTFDGQIGIEVKVVEGGRHSTVPKTALTDRNIELQPTLNAFLQSGIGKYLRRRLRRAGIDLSDQTRNQRLAREGSRTGRLATVDLSNASDTIALSLVRWLVPADWLHAMDLTRTETCEFRGEVVRLHRYSSMGNGFTFELETLIFWALARSVIDEVGCDNTVGVYGDDIIVPVEAYPLLRRAFSVCGFTVNDRKSFATGPFRESCGADWFDGILVRPYYVTQRVGCVADLVVLANKIYRAGIACSPTYALTKGFRRAWFKILRLIPRRLLNVIAIGDPDSDEFLLAPRARPGRTLVFIATQYERGFYNSRAAALYRTWRREATNVFREWEVGRENRYGPVFRSAPVRATIRGNGEWSLL